MAAFLRRNAATGVSFTTQEPRRARPAPVVLDPRRDLYAKRLETGRLRVAEYSCRQHDNPS